MGNEQGTKILNKEQGIKNREGECARIMPRIKYRTRNKELKTRKENAPE